MENKKILEKIQKMTEEIGFDLVGIAEIASSLAMTKENDKLDEWVGNGYHAEMEWFADSLEKRKDILKVMPEAKSVICVAMNYYPAPFSKRTRDEKSVGRVARYAVGRPARLNDVSRSGGDYHKIFDKKLKLFAQNLKEIFSEGDFRYYSDAGPVLERAWAVQAGLGFIGKNTNLITKYGSWVLLGEVITNIDLGLDSRLRGNDKFQGSCGDCRRCLDACPTGALCASYTVDARKCISYLTIEYKGEIPMELREKMGNRIFGCDACQEICPFNIGRQKEGLNFKAAQEKYPYLSLRRYSVSMTDMEKEEKEGFEEFCGNYEIELKEILSIKTDEEFLKKFAGTPLMRAKRRGLVRNACIAAGNSGDLPTQAGLSAQAGKSLLPYLKECLKDSEPIIVEAAKWAIVNIVKSEE